MGSNPIDPATSRATAQRVVDEDVLTVDGEKLWRWFLLYEGNIHESAEALRDAIVRAAQPDLNAVKREAARKALTELANTYGHTFRIHGSTLCQSIESFRDRYLAREYPDPAPPSVPVVFGPCVLDNGNTIGLGAVTSVLSDDETVAALLDPKDTRADEARLRAWLKQARHFLSSHPAASHGGAR